jgi:hypothetical protein
LDEFSAQRAKLTEQKKEVVEARKQLAQQQLLLHTKLRKLLLQQVTAGYRA